MRNVLKAVALGSGWIALLAAMWTTEHDRVAVSKIESGRVIDVAHVVEDDGRHEMTVRELIAQLAPLNWDALVLVGRKGETAHFATRVYQTPRLDIPDGLVWIEADPGRGVAHALDLERQAVEATCTVQRVGDVIAERVRLTGRPNP